jgi:alpha-ketoglutarate-dependent taurine dioxygenase
MTVTVSTTIEIRPLTAVIGAEVVGLDLGADLPDAVIADINTALLRWKVLFFRNQRIDEGQQIAFAHRFGELTPAHPVQGSLEGHPQVYAVEARQLRSREHDGRRRDTGWHTDITFVANPAKASILRGVTIPEYGGDTLWTNLVAAYEDLSTPIRSLVDGLQAVHRWHNYDGSVPAGQPVPSAVHPVVRVHPETGERALFVNPIFTTHIIGLSGRESYLLLDLLFHQIGRPEFSVRFRWEPGSVAFWDNRATAHVGPVDIEHADLDREVRRVTLVGDVPVGPDGFTSSPIQGELFL